MNLEDTGVISCETNSFMAGWFGSESRVSLLLHKCYAFTLTVTSDIVVMRAGEPDKEICLDPDHMSNTFPFYHTLSCESQTPSLSRQLLMSREDIQLFQGLGGKFCLENRSSSDGNDQLLLGINLAGVSRGKLNFSLTLVCRGVGTPGSGGSDVLETSALIKPSELCLLKWGKSRSSGKSGVFG